jgi:hypothetical protein
VLGPTNIGQLVASTAHPHVRTPQLRADGLVGTQPVRGLSGRHAGAIMSAGGSSGRRRLRSWTVPRRQPDHRAPDPDRIDLRSSWTIVEHVATEVSGPALEDHASPLRSAGAFAASASLTVGIGAQQ